MSAPRHFRILSHPSRAELRERLVEQIPHAEVVENTEHPWAGMRDLLRRPFDGDHLIVLQDDAIVCDDFEVALDRVLAEQPDRLVCLFHAGQPQKTARQILLAEPLSFVELRYERGTDWTPTVAVAWPRALVEQWQQFRWAGTKKQRGDDLPIGHFARANGGAVACVPSIVQHPDDAPSTWRRFRPPRYGRDPLYVAVRFEQISPWALDKIPAVR